MVSQDTSAARHFVEKRTILFGECDPAGILYTPRICEYIVEGALRFLSACLGEPFERYMFAKDLTLPARNLTVDFLRPLTWDDEIEIRAGLLEMRTHSYTVQISAFDASGNAAFSGRITQVCVGHKSRRVEAVPDNFRAGLLQGPQPD